MSDPKSVPTTEAFNKVLRALLAADPNACSPTQAGAFDDLAAERVRSSSNKAISATTERRRKAKALEFLEGEMSAFVANDKVRTSPAFHTIEELKKHASQAIAAYSNKSSSPEQSSQPNWKLIRRFGIKPPLPVTRAEREAFATAVEETSSVLAWPNPQQTEITKAALTAARETLRFIGGSGPSSSQLERIQRDVNPIITQLTQQFDIARGEQLDHSFCTTVVLSDFTVKALAMVSQD